MNNSKDCFTASDEGSISVEFALLFPVILCLLLITIELFNMFDTDRKLYLVASTTSDLLSELIVDSKDFEEYGNDDRSANKTDYKKICDIIYAGKKNLYPQNTNNLSLLVSYFQNGQKQWEINDNDFDEQMSIAIPESIKRESGNFNHIYVSVKYKYNILSGNIISNLSNFNLRKGYWITIRNEETIECTDCNSSRHCSN
ncbi:TadE/TadG family type IV pilus assembly protein [Brucella gallinifaecis]|uniref:TadE-like domain-containing protein n=1 Tax=Brucella gallinifaecis TaxID=215590 RepID=A0A502BNJ5_9HYPH|nr:TadE/TadG family type IV pilus assembly protein [Brucella gallinifaecis]TPF75440.1 hypothetical protein FHY56_09270 [Brucella gallinifaecis]